MDLDAYLARIGYEGPRAPTLDVLTALMTAHVQTIPFENLDVLLGRPIELDLESIERKLVGDRRGGYCFEHNPLFFEVLQQLGFEAKLISARVRLNRPRDFTPPRTHTFSRVELGGSSWLVDVGVGAASLTAPLRFEEGIVQETPHETRRLVRENGVLFHQIRYGDVWNDVYETTGEAMPFIDRVVANWFTSTHPQSHFRDRVMAARAAPGGRRITLLNRELTVRERDGKSEKRMLETPDEFRAALADSFGLHFGDGVLEASSLLGRLLLF